MREGVLASIGGFGALFEVPKRYQEPVLVVSAPTAWAPSCKLAFEWNMHDTVGIDLVAMSVNDVLVARRRAAVLPRLLCLRQAGRGHRRCRRWRHCRRAASCRAAP